MQPQEQPGLREPHVHEVRPKDRMPPRVQRWMDRLGNSRTALWTLFYASVAETLLVPIPIELILIPYMLANRARIWLTCAVVLAGNIVAALFGYALGYFAFSTFAPGLIETMGWTEGFAEFQRLFAQYGFWSIVAIGIIPIPFQAAMLVAGAAKYPVVMFLAAALVARGTRYFGLGALVYWMGDRTLAFIQRHKKTAAFGSLGLAAAAAWWFWPG